MDNAIEGRNHFVGGGNNNMQRVDMLKAAIKAGANHLHNIAVIATDKICQRLIKQILDLNP